MATEQAMKAGTVVRITRVDPSLVQYIGHRVGQVGVVFKNRTTFDDMRDALDDAIASGLVPKDGIINDGPHETVRFADGDFDIFAVSELEIVERPGREDHGNR